MSEPKGHWWSQDRFSENPPLTTAIEAVMRERELEAARERARLTVLDLTARDKRFLKAMKISP